MRAKLAAAAIAVLSLATPSLAGATCPNVVGGSADVDAIDETQRLRFLRANLDDEADKARLWTWGWIGAGAAATTFNGVWAATGDYSDRVDRLGSASGTFLLTLTTVISPLSVPTDELESGPATVADTDARRCSSVVRAERVLKSVADDEADRQRFVMHLAPIGGALAGGLVLGVGYDHWTSGALSAGIGIAVSELKMLTQPTGAVRTLERYRTGVLTNDGPRIGWNVVPSVGKGGGGLALSVVF